MEAERFAETVRVKPAPDVLATAFGAETVILDLKAGVYFGLDDVGTRIWNLIEQRETVRGIRDVVLAEYDVERAECDADLQKLLRELVSRGLAEVDDGVS